jgi:hypothetical protein
MILTRIESEPIVGKTCNACACAFFVSELVDEALAHVTAYMEAAPKYVTTCQVCGKVGFSVHEQVNVNKHAILCRKCAERFSRIVEFEQNTLN